MPIHFKSYECGGLLVLRFRLNQGPSAIFLLRLDLRHSALNFALGVSDYNSLAIQLLATLIGVKVNHSNLLRLVLKLIGLTILCVLQLLNRNGVLLEPSSFLIVIYTGDMLIAHCLFLATDSDFLFISIARVGVLRAIALLERS